MSTEQDRSLISIAASLYSHLIDDLNKAPITRRKEILLSLFNIIHKMDEGVLELIHGQDPFKKDLPVAPVPPTAPPDNAVGPESTEKPTQSV